MRIDGTQLERKYCDRCGFSIKEVFALFPKERTCPVCNWEFDDYAFEHPDEAVYKDKGSLNFERFFHFVIGRHSDDDLFWKIFRADNTSKAYRIWREMHPELGGRFDMCDFKEHPDFEKTVMEMTDYSRYDEEE